VAVVHVKVVFVPGFAQRTDKFSAHRSSEPSERHATERGHGLDKRFQMVHALVRRELARILECLERRELRVIIIIGAVAGELVFGHAPRALHPMPGGVYYFELVHFQAVAVL
jgi:hypothetical protein